MNDISYVPKTQGTGAKIPSIHFCLFLYHIIRQYHTSIELNITHRLFFSLIAPVLMCLNCSVLIVSLQLNILHSCLLAGTNSEMSNASETEDLGDRESRPKGVGADDRGSKRGGRGRGSSAGRGRGGPGPRNINTISSGTAHWNLNIFKSEMYVVIRSCILL